ncbi:DNA-directed RNA polymerase III subunit RPC5 [Condylostylus longicornis]|uniref:DNA-directed RNA polymerase III subunit RPC5 n=1 Tax=Condylostylus longicornis TaxID=2530218 RepID=UPI00244DBB9A|nr:DNA-directed RNA polymerase III subunit RPC5 [Condylostylus longicornis]
MDEDDDPIVEEIPIFLSKSLENNLFVLQFPNRSSDRSTDGEDIVNSCIKPINREIKIDFHVDSESKFYDRFKGKSFAIASDGKTQTSTKNQNERPSFPNGIMDKQAYISSKPIENSNKYFVGIFFDKEMHLTPIADILQMRPNFSYFDKEDKRTKAEQKAAASQDADDEDEELQQVTVKFSKTGQTSESVKKALEKSYEHFIKKSAEEPWCEAMWYPSNSPTAEKERQKLFSNKTDIADYALSMSGKKYIELLIPPERSDQNLESILPSNIVSKAKLKTMNITNQLKHILKDGRMLSFIDIMTILEKCDQDITTEKVLRNLPLIGVLIRGNWVVQSEILYPEESVSKTNGVSAELMCRARDYVIYKFSKQEYLHRRKVIIATQLPPEETTEILTSIAKLNPEKKWELLLPPDVGFESRYPDLVQRQEGMWNLTQEKYLGMDFEKSPKRSRKRSLREVKVEPKS